MLRAAAGLGPEDLCHACQGEGRCAALEQELKEIESLDRTPIPRYASSIGRNVCLTHHALVHGPCCISDRYFVGFKAMVPDEVVGEEFLIGLGATGLGVSLPAGRYASHNIVVATQVQAASLPAVAVDWKHLSTKVVQVNQELAAGYREVLLQAAIVPLATSDVDVAHG
jgi:carbonic anhydrase/acetyltransferase-like protein (isoleucine patch superfamily)